jgi:hypothetical protein
MRDATFGNIHKHGQFSCASCGSSSCPQKQPVTSAKPRGKISCEKRRNEKSPKTDAGPIKRIKGIWYGVISRGKTGNSQSDTNLLGNWGNGDLGVRGGARRARRGAGDDSLGAELWAGLQDLIVRRKVQQRRAEGGIGGRALERGRSCLFEHP